MPELAPARGARLAWPDLPARLRAAVEGWLGSPVASATSQPDGFSPSLAARLRTADGRRVFAKAAGPAPYPAAARTLRREARVMAALPGAAPAPRLLWRYDEGDGGWVLLLFEDIAGRHPARPWRADELDRVVGTLAALSTLLTPSPLPPSVVSPATGWRVLRCGGWRQLRDDPPDGLDAWTARHLGGLADLEARAAAAAAGDTLLHLDLRADNLLLTPERVLVVDWPHARVGAAWLDAVFFAPSVAMQGGPAPQSLVERHPACRAADPDAVTAVVAAVAGFFTWEARQPPPPGVAPGLRAFQKAQGAVARRWVAARTGWT